MTLAALGRDYWEWVLRTDPLHATYLGDFRYNDRLPDISAAGLARQKAELTDLLQRAGELQLDGDEAVSADILRLLIEDQIGERSHQFEEWNLDQLFGPQMWLMELANYHPLRDGKDRADLATRYRAFDGYIDDYVANLRRGVDNGRCAPAVARDRVAAQLRDALETPADRSPLVPPGDDGVVRDAVTEKVYPAFQRLLDFLQSYPARTEVGIW